MNKVLQADIDEFVLDFPLKDNLEDKTFLITGPKGDCPWQADAAA